MSMPPNSGKYAYCAASHADGRSIPAHRQRRQPETRRLPAIGWSACGGKPETVRSKGFSNGVLLHTGSLPDPPPVPSRPSPACRDWGEKGRAGGVRCQSLIVAVYRAPPRHKTGAASNRRHDAKKVPWRRQYLAEREGFEPSVPDKGTHDFQSCTIGHSVTSPEKMENGGQE